MKITSRMMLTVLLGVMLFIGLLYLPKVIGSPGFQNLYGQEISKECQDDVCHLPAQNEIKPTEATAVTIEQSVPEKKIKYVTSDNKILIKSMLESHGLMFWIGIWMFGLLLAFSPCVLPLILLIFGFFTESREISYRKSIILALTYVLALSLSLSIIGMLGSAFGIYLSTYFQNKWVLGVFCILLLGFSLSLLGFYKVHLPPWLRHYVVRQNKFRSDYKFFEVIMMGVFATLIISPCIAAQLILAMSYNVYSGDMMLGVAALFMIGMGMGTPLLIAVIVKMNLMPKEGPWQRLLNFYTGVLLLGITIWLSSRIVSVAWQALFWSILVIFTAIHIYSLRAYKKVNVYTVLWKTISVIMLTYGVVMFVQFVLGNQNIIQSVKDTGAGSVDRHLIKTVSGVGELEKELHRAQEEKKFVLLFFGQFGCEACDQFKSYLADDRMQELLKNFVLVEIDLSIPGSESQKIARDFNVGGTPEVVFFDTSGVQNETRIIGMVTMSDFQKIIKDITGKQP